LFTTRTPRLFFAAAAAALLQVLLIIFWSDFECPPVLAFEVEPGDPRRRKTPGPFWAHGKLRSGKREANGIPSGNLTWLLKMPINSGFSH